MLPAAALPPKAMLLQILGAPGAAADIKSTPLLLQLHVPTSSTLHNVPCMNQLQLLQFALCSAFPTKYQPPPTQCLLSPHHNHMPGNNIYTITHTHPFPTPFTAWTSPAYVVVLVG